MSFGDSALLLHLVSLKKEIQKFDKSVETKFLAHLQLIYLSLIHASFDLSGDKEAKKVFT